VGTKKLALDGTLALMLHNINETGAPVVPWQKSVQDIPWPISKLCIYQRLIESTHDQAAFDPDKLVAPISGITVNGYDWLDRPKKVSAWYESRRPKSQH
jgi:hypothetical protein